MEKFIQFVDGVDNIGDFGGAAFEFVGAFEFSGGGSVVAYSAGVVFFTDSLGEVIPVRELLEIDGFRDEIQRRFYSDFLCDSQDKTPF